MLQGWQWYTKTVIIFTDVLSQGMLYKFSDPDLHEYLVSDVESLCKCINEFIHAPIVNGKQFNFLHPDAAFWTEQSMTEGQFSLDFEDRVI